MYRTPNQSHEHAAYSVVRLNKPKKQAPEDFLEKTFSEYVGCHPTYIIPLIRAHNYILRDLGPLNFAVRHYIGILAAARHRCTYLVNFCKKEFLFNGGDPEWLKGLHNAPSKLRALNVINKILAHQPWLFTKAHVEQLTKGPNPWSMSELLHAIVILSHFHALCSLSFGCKFGIAGPENFDDDDGDYEEVEIEELCFDPHNGNHRIRKIVKRSPASRLIIERCRQLELENAQLAEFMKVQIKLKTMEKETNKEKRKRNRAKNRAQNKEARELQQRQQMALVSSAPVTVVGGDGGGVGQTSPTCDRGLIGGGVGVGVGVSSVGSVASSASSTGSAAMLSCSPITGSERSKPKKERKTSLDTQSNKVTTTTSSGSSKTAPVSPTTKSSHSGSSSPVSSSNSSLASSTSSASSTESVDCALGSSLSLPSSTTTSIITTATRAESKATKDEEIVVDGSASSSSFTPNTWSDDEWKRLNYGTLVEDAEFGYHDFASRGRPSDVSTFRYQDYQWDDQGYSLSNLLYPDIGPFLDEKFKVGYNLTYYTLGPKTNIDTSPFRRAIWNYIQCVYGMRHDDYNYREVNILLERRLKTFIKCLACYPENAVKQDFSNVMQGFRASEKIHVIIMVTEARLQTELLYALRSMTEYMKH